MGGYAFLKPCYPPMLFPRMSTPQYNAVKAHVSARLIDLFHHVGVGAEAPEKHDHGDVDFVVCRPRGPKLVGASVEDVQELVEKSLGARFGKVVHGVLFLAVPMPEVGGGGGGGGGGEEEDADVPEGDAVDEVGRDGGEVKQQDLVQIDITMCPAPSLFAYALFSVSYGDLFGFLKTGSRPFGLSFRPSGLWMRVPPTDETDVGDDGSSNGNGRGKMGAAGDDKSLLFLSNDVDAILSFLGLDASRWKQGFGSLGEVFEFAVSARWFSRKDFDGRKKREEGDSPAIPSPSPSLHSTMSSASGATATSSSTATLTTTCSENTGTTKKRRRNHNRTNNNSYETYKAKKRSVWNTFVSEFLPLQKLPNDPFAPVESGEPLPAESQLLERPALKRHDSAVDSPLTISFSPRVAASASSSVTLSFSDGEDDDAGMQQRQQTQHHQQKPQDTASNGCDTSEAGVDAAADDARAAVLAAALSHFPGAAERYHVLRATQAAVHREKLFWQRVRAELPGIIVQRQQEQEQKQWQQSEGEGEGQGFEVQMERWAASGRGKVSKERLAHTITALRRYTAFSSDTGDGNSGGEQEHVVIRVPRLRPHPKLDDEKFVPWTSTPSTTTASMTDDDLMDFIRDNYAVAYEIDRSRTRPVREKQREAAAKRKAERREQAEKELERERERAREVEEERREKEREGVCIGQ